VVIARPHPSKEGKYEIVDGEHTWQNHSELLAEGEKGFGMTWCDVRELSDFEAKKLCYHANTDRGELNPYNEAEFFKGMMDEQVKANKDFKQKDLAEMMGVSESHISRTIGLLRMPEDIKEKAKDLPIAVQEKIASIKEPEAQAEALDKIVKGEKTVEQASKVIEQVKREEKRKEAKNGGEAFEDEFRMDVSPKTITSKILANITKVEPEEFIIKCQDEVEITCNKYTGIIVKVKGKDYLSITGVLGQNDKINVVALQARSIRDIQEAKDFIDGLMGGE
jgi:ParB/RepB/Spo0J family partition protein